MADDADPPRKFYELKPRDFERVNPPRSESDTGASASDPGPARPPDLPTDVRELHRLAATPGPVLSTAESRERENDVHELLRANHAREAELGLHKVSFANVRKSRRFRDWLIAIVCLNVFFGVLAVYGYRSGNTALFVFSIAGIGTVTAGMTWVMWFVMDKW